MTGTERPEPRAAGDDFVAMKSAPELKEFSDP
jgi:hypothetical protein